MPEPRTITDAAGFIRRGELTPSELLEQCLARIDRYEAKVRAWVFIDRGRARQDAERLTAELKAGQNRGPLHGIPVGVKDIIDVFDLPTGCGSKRWANSYARRDANCVKRLRDAGAVIVGKTVTTAYASFDPPVTRNPWNLDRTPGGSSSGSAVAVACGMCLGALASQTGGSITRPASYCGVYSLKASSGRVSTDGVLPLAPTARRPRRRERAPPVLLPQRDGVGRPPPLQAPLNAASLPRDARPGDGRCVRGPPPPDGRSTLGVE
jgi:aspartyl-tRNA(Asn)/glutamyl-tRNA(Gln) amidotransferase subunit A